MLKKLAGLLRRPPRPRFVLAPRVAARRSVCISYISEPFSGDWTENKARGHTNAFEVTAMAQAWLDRGFRVEICGYEDGDYVPPSDCVVAIDIHRNLERWAALPGGGFLKILHATGCHWKFQNDAEMKRLESLRMRRGVRLAPRRQVPPSRAAQVADEIALTGNGFTMETFRHAGKPMTRIPISSAYEFTWPERRSFEEVRRRFLWIGSYGMVHKGLDLVLEAFAAMPHLDLTVCGRPEKEPDFFRAYEKELTGTPNIRLLGWLDLSSPQFAEIARTHCAVVYPSCAEGGGGTVIHCMHAGLIPICTNEASVDMSSFGTMINEATVSAVAESVSSIAEAPARAIEGRARHSYDHARRKHRRDLFASAYADFVESTIARIN
ncbi:MAG: glycosyltransferase [Chthoniobacterales bacterium]|nr:glycosyltransferase [Chthoniobacterales bacterium]